MQQKQQKEFALKSDCKRNFQQGYNRVSQRAL